jgi:hypothetical protein
MRVAIKQTEKDQGIINGEKKATEWDNLTGREE